MVLNDKFVQFCPILWFHHVDFIKFVSLELLSNSLEVGGFGTGYMKSKPKDKKVNIAVT